ncbi:MAG: hypothetical protein EZS28_030937, partial [Streblomastix strix]
MLFLQHNFINVSGVEYFVGTTGNDSNSCLQQEPCETLDKQILKSQAITASQYTLYILDNTTLYTIFTVSSQQETQPFPRLFTNYPRRSATQSQIQINADGQFRITGNAQFEYINFTMSEEVSNTEGGILNIQQNSPYSFLDIQFCNFIRCHATILGGALYVSISTGAVVTVTNTTFVQCECVTGSGHGGAIYADIIDDSRLELYNVICDTCIAKSGGGLYANFSEGNLTFRGQCKFMDCQCTSGGVGCYLEILEFSVNITIIGEIQFERCISTVGSSAMVIYSRSTGYIHINQMSFRDCAGVNGAGGLYINAMLDSEITITGKVSINNCTNGWGSGGGFQCNLYGGFINITGELEFEECEGPSGSGFFILLENHAVAEINKALFKNCITWEYGGGFAALIRDESQLIFKGVAQFKQCSCISEIYIPVGGGGIYSDINDGVLNMKDSIFDTCNCSQPGTGGAVSIIQGVNGKVFIKNASFTNCKTLLNSTKSLFGWGGALFLFTSVSSNALSSSNLLMNDLSFGGCESVIAGHNIHIRSTDTKATGLAISSQQLLTVNGTTDLYTSPDYEVDYMGIDESNLNEGNNIPYNHLPLFASNAPIEAVKDYYIDADSSDTRYRNIQLSGGAIYAVINGGSMQLNEIVMNQCKSESGGAVFANISNQGKLILNSQCQFYQCESYGNGGGIYVQMDFTTQSQFVINGYGGGIFLTGTGDFNQQSELLDLHGMKIYQNSASNNGQSVFVVMANVVEWCQQGILGEYVKGNYSDLNSDVNELEG